MPTATSTDALFADVSAVDWNDLAAVTAVSDTLLGALDPLPELCGNDRATEPERPSAAIGSPPPARAAPTAARLCAGLNDPGRPTRGTPRAGQPSPGGGGTGVDPELLWSPHVPPRRAVTGRVVITETDAIRAYPELAYLGVIRAPDGAFATSPTTTGRSTAWSAPSTGPATPMPCGSTAAPTPTPCGCSPTPPAHGVA